MNIDYKKAFWALAAVFAVVVIVGSIVYIHHAHEEWQRTQIEQLQQQVGTIVGYLNANPIPKR